MDFNSGLGTTGTDGFADAIGFRQNVQPQARHFIDEIAKQLAPQSIQTPHLPQAMLIATSKIGVAAYYLRI
jgi:hypothetical protein